MRCSEALIPGRHLPKTKVPLSIGAQCASPPHHNNQELPYYDDCSL